MERDTDAGAERSQCRPDGGSVDAETERHLSTCRSSLPGELDRRPVGFGFDGFIDRVRKTITERVGEDYETHAGLRELGEQIVASAGADSSLVVEWTTEGTRTGGHTAHVGRAYDRLGFDVTVVGTFGRPIEDAYAEEFADQTIVSIAEPGYDDAVEFGEHKLMLTDVGVQRDLDWEMIVDRVGLDALADHLDGLAMLGTGYWAMITSMPTIWTGLREDLFPVLADPPEFVLTDPFDIRGLPTEDLRAGAGPLDRLDDSVPVTMSANRAEIYYIADAFHDGDADDLPFEEAASVVRDSLGVSEVAGHAIDHSVYITDTGTFRIESPRTTDPVITTSAGDHFATGLSLAKLQGLEEPSALVLASAVAGWFVRNGEPPTYAQAREFVDDYEWYFGDPER